MKNLFNAVQMTRPNKNKFDLSHDVKLSLNMGELVPIMCTEVVPSDKFNISCQSLLRFAPLVSPVMHRYDVTMHYFFVPTRLLWDGWEKYITNGGDENPQEALPAFPFIQYGKSGLVDRTTRLADYFGLPTPIDAGGFEEINALPFYAYNKIFNDYYRDQNLIDKLVEKAVDGDNSNLWDTGIIGGLKYRAWEHDYFTSCLPFAQKGQPVQIPIVGNVSVDPLAAGTSGLLRDAATQNIGAAGNLQSSDGIATPVAGELLIDAVGKIPAIYDPNGTLIVSNAETTINDLRRAYRLQEWLEKSARGGTRYIENILMHFGVRSSDKRLQRAEYITGVKSPVTISEVLNTTGTEDLPQGNMAGHGVSVTSGNYGTYYAEEHGYIIGIMSVMPKTAYQQGIAKMWLKTKDPFQFYWPSFANIGEQEVLNKEIYAYQGENGEETFGYVPRYAEYKFENNRVAGDFRTSLDFWHHGRIFDSPPALNQDFISCTPDNRIFAVEDPAVQKLYAHVYNQVTAIRPMPKFGTPMM